MIGQDPGRVERKADNDFERFWEEIRVQGSRVPELVSVDIGRAIFRAGWFSGGAKTAQELGIEAALRHPAMRRLPS